jgi:hypothetical protein
MQPLTSITGPPPAAAGDHTVIDHTSAGAICPDAWQIAPPESTRDPD